MKCERCDGSGRLSVMYPGSMTTGVCADCGGTGRGPLIHVGDCIEWMRTLEDKSVDHVITDPPFEGEAHTLQRRLKPAGWRATGLVRSAPLTFAAITPELRVAASAEIARIARRWVVVFCQIEALHLWRSSLEESGCVYKRSGFWRKPDGQPQLTGDRPGMGYETIIIAHARGRSRWNGGGKHAVWTFSKHQSGRTSDHQTEKPLSLMEALVRDFTDPGELVIDPFAGSGTTGVACLKQGRRFLGCEINPGYAETARRRLSETREQKEMFG